jgi:hypothetical protein
LALGFGFDVFRLIIFAQTIVRRVKWDVLFENGSGNFKSVEDSAVGDSAQSRDGFQNILTENILIFIRERIFTDMKPNSLKDDHGASILAISIVEIMAVHEFTFNRKHRLGDTTSLDFTRGKWRKAAEGPL